MPGPPLFTEYFICSLLKPARCSSRTACSASAACSKTPTTTGRSVIAISLLLSEDPFLHDKHREKGNARGTPLPYILASGVNIPGLIGCSPLRSYLHSRPGH